MKSTTELLKLKFVFSQRQPLPPDKFLQEYNRRVLYADSRIQYWEQLEELHRTGFLVPIFRFAKNIKTIKSAAYEYLLRQNPTFVHCLNASNNLGFLIDPHGESYQPWYSYIRWNKNQTYWNSSFFYSPYQLLLAPTIRSLSSKMVFQRTRRKHGSPFKFKLKLDENTQKDLEKTVKENAELVIALTVLETRYLPFIRGHWYSAKLMNLSWDEMLAYRESFDPAEMLNWIGWDANQVKKTVERLRWDVDSFDPLRDWDELVKLCRPEKWETLRGDALIALDYHIAAEILSRFYEDLVKVGLASAIESPPKASGNPRDKQWKANLDNLDKVLMDFGISPYPSLVLILEGATEFGLVPLVMSLLGIPQHNSFITLFNAKGSTKDFGLLASYVAVPKIGEQLRDDYSEINRPLTRYLVAMDAENKFKSSDECEEKRKSWVTQICEALPEEYRTSKLENIIDTLVSVETWDGKVFEFAHFTDKEIAEAILEVYTKFQGNMDYLLSKLRVANRNDLLLKIQDCVANIRSRNHNIDSLMRGWDHQPRKPEIGLALWPVLEEKIRKAIATGNINSIPVARVLLKAKEDAVMIRRSDIAISH